MAAQGWQLTKDTQGPIVCKRCRAHNKNHLPMTCIRTMPYSSREPCTF